MTLDTGAHLVASHKPPNRSKAGPQTKSKRCREGVWEGMWVKAGARRVFLEEEVCKQDSSRERGRERTHPTPQAKHVSKAGTPKISWVQRPCHVGARRLG